MEAYIYDAVRTPRGRGKPDGSLHEITPIQLATQVLEAIRDRTAIDTVDVENHLDSMPGADRLNWRTSIVDLLKLINVDSDYASRKALASELGREDYEGSAEDNVWLHRRTMRELAAHGGKVPPEYLD